MTGSESERERERESRVLLVDDRIGSKELLPELTKKLGLPAKIGRLMFGDVSLDGKGPGGKTVHVGVERKTIGDLLNSIQSGRLSSHQLPGLVQIYDYRWIVVEGLWKPGKDNLIEEWRGGGWRPVRSRMSYFDLDRYLITLEVRGGCHVRRTGSLWETAVFVGNLYRWWGKEWESHRGHLGLEKGLTPDRVLFSRPSYPRLVANVLPGIGWEKSKSVAKHFHTVQAMVEGSPKDWERIPGIGKKLSIQLPMLLAGVYGVERSREE